MDATRDCLTFKHGVGSKETGYRIGTRVWSNLKMSSDVRKARGIARMLDRFDQTEVDRVIAFEGKYR